MSERATLHTETSTDDTEGNDDRWKDMHERLNDVLQRCAKDGTRPFDPAVETSVRDAIYEFTNDPGVLASASRMIDVYLCASQIFAMRDSMTSSRRAVTDDLVEAIPALSGLHDRRAADIETHRSQITATIRDSYLN